MGVPRPVAAAAAKLNLPERVVQAALKAHAAGTDALEG